MGDEFEVMHTLKLVPACFACGLCGDCLWLVVWSGLHVEIMHANKQRVRRENWKVAA